MIVMLFMYIFTSFLFRFPLAFYVVIPKKEKSVEIRLIRIMEENLKKFVLKKKKYSLRKPFLIYLISMLLCMVILL